MTIQPYTIWQLTSYIRDLFDQDPRLFDVWVEGEISTFAARTGPDGEPLAGPLLLALLAAGVQEEPE